MNDESSTSQLKGKRQQGESSLASNYPREKEVDSFIVQNSIHEQSLDLEDFTSVDGFLKCLETQG